MLLLALIPAVLLALSVPNERSASAQPTPQVDPWAWGRNSEGQLGNGTTSVTANSNPTQVSNLTDVIDVAGGGLHNLALASADNTDPTTLTGQTLKLVNTATGKRVKNVAVSYDATTRTVTLDPFGTSTTLLAKKTKYRVTITTGVENLAGISLDQNQPKVGSFTTGRRA